MLEIIYLDKDVLPLHNLVSEFWYRFIKSYNFLNQQLRLQYDYIDNTIRLVITDHTFHSWKESYCSS